MPLSCSTTSSSSKTERFLRVHRVVRRKDYLRIQQFGQRIRAPHFVFMVLPHPGQPRLGITVTSKIGCAARRNRIKRIAREVFRRNRELFPQNCQTVMVARLGAERLGYEAVLNELNGAQKAITDYTRNISPSGSGE